MQQLSELAQASQGGELAKLGSLFSQLITLQKVLQHVDAGVQSAVQSNTSQPSSEARRRHATLKVPQNFNAMVAERPSNLKV